MPARVRVAQMVRYGPESRNARICARRYARRYVLFLRGVRMCIFISWTIRHLAARYELLRVSRRARDAAQDRVVLRLVLDRARPAKVDWTYILCVTERLPPHFPSSMCLSCCLSHRRHVRCTPHTRPHALPRRGFRRRILDTRIIYTEKVLSVNGPICRREELERFKA